MSVTFVGSASAGAQSGAASITHGLTIEEGDFVALVVQFNNNGLTIDAATDGFTEESSWSGFGSLTHTVGIYWKAATASEPATYNIGGANSRWALHLFVFKGVDTTDPVDVPTVELSAQPSSAPAIPSIDVAAGSVAIAWYANDTTGAANDAVDNSYAGLTGENDQLSGAAYGIHPSGGATGVTTFSGGAILGWTGGHVAFKEAAGGGSQLFYDDFAGWPDETLLDDAGYAATTGQTYVKATTKSGRMMTRASVDGCKAEASGQLGSMKIYNGGVLEQFPRTCRVRFTAAKGSGFRLPRVMWRASDETGDGTDAFIIDWQPGGNCNVVWMTDVENEIQNSTIGTLFTLNGSTLVYFQVDIADDDLTITAWDDGYEGASQLGTLSWLESTYAPGRDTVATNVVGWACYGDNDVVGDEPYYGELEVFDPATPEVTEIDFGIGDLRAAGMKYGTATLFVREAVPGLAGTPLVRYWLDEADSGQGPTNVADASGNGYDLDDVEHGVGPYAQWTSLPTGRGFQSLSSTPSDGHNHRARHTINDVSDLVRDAIDGATEVTIEVVLDLTAGNSSTARIFAVQDRTGGNPRIGLAHTTSALRFYVNGAFGTALGNLVGAGRQVLTFVYTPGVAGTNRYYVDGVDTAALTDQGAVSMPAGLDLIMHNRESSGNWGRSSQSVLYYAAIYDSALTPAEVAANAAMLLASDDP